MVRRFSSSTTSLSEKLDKYSQNINSNRFNIGVFTDLHYENRDVYFEGMNSNYPTGYYTASVINDIQKSLGNRVDILHLNGDVINGVTTCVEAGKRMNRALVQSWLYPATSITADMSWTIGNHDDLSPSGLVLKSVKELTRKNVIELEWFQAQSDRLHNGNFDQSSMSYFKDYPDKKIRYIVLDTEEPPNYLDENNKLIYSRWLWHGIKNDTFNWLISNALHNVPNGMTVVIMTHCPLWFNDSVDYKWSDKGARMINFDVLRDILDAYISGRKINIKKSEDDINKWLVNITGKDDIKRLYGAGWAVDLTADFIKQGSRDLAGVFSGHTHKEEIADLGLFKNVQLQHAFSNNLNEVDNIGFTTVEIDTSKRIVSLKGFGIATDREYKY